MLAAAVALGYPERAGLQHLTHKVLLAQTTALLATQVRSVYKAAVLEEVLVEAPAQARLAALRFLARLAAAVVVEKRQPPLIWTPPLVDHLDTSLAAQAAQTLAQ